MTCGDKDHCLLWAGVPPEILFRDAVPKVAGVILPRVVGESLDRGCAFAGDRMQSCR